MLITLETVRDKWGACYDADRLAALYDRPYTPLEVLENQHGPWADVPAKDRLWTVFHRGVLPDRVFRYFAANCAERALTRERAAGREPDPSLWNAVRVARLRADGNATDEELAAAYRAAYAYAADADADAYAGAAAYAYAADAYAERAAQVADLIRLIKENA